MKQLGQDGANKINAKFAGIRTLIEVIVRNRLADLRINLDAIWAVALILTGGWDVNPLQCPVKHGSTIAHERLVSYPTNQ